MWKELQDSLSIVEIKQSYICLRKALKKCHLHEVLDVLLVDLGVGTAILVWTLLGTLARIRKLLLLRHQSTCVTVFPLV